MEPLASVTELAARLPFVMDDDEEREAAGALDDLSEDARRYGSYGWDALNVPRQVRNLVLRAAVRHMKNMDGFIQSRAGDESVTWTDRGEQSGTAHFTTQEIAAIRVVAGIGGGLYTAQTGWGTTFAPDRKSSVGMARDDMGQLIHYFVSDDGGPWS